MGAAAYCDPQPPFFVPGNTVLLELFSALSYDFGYDRLYDKGFFEKRAERKTGIPVYRSAAAFIRYIFIGFLPSAKRAVCQNDGMVKGAKKGAYLVGRANAGKDGRRKRTISNLGKALYGRQPGVSDRTQMARAIRKFPTKRSHDFSNESVFKRVCRRPLWQAWLGGIPTGRKSPFGGADGYLPPEAGRMDVSGRAYIGRDEAIRRPSGSFYYRRSRAAKNG